MELAQKLYILDPTRLDPAKIAEPMSRSGNADHAEMRNGQNRKC